AVIGKSSEVHRQLQWTFLKHASIMHLFKDACKVHVMCGQQIIRRLRILDRAGRWMMAASVAMTALGVWVAYGLAHYLNLAQQVLAHLTTIIFPVGLKIGYVIMLYAQQQIRKCPGFSKSERTGR
ncbi:MAG: hypothetical protein OIF34_01565, partial [Porticoccaceae bacterium]|nr:hypothetical protein [Porticoccaceae bacterium]